MEIDLVKAIETFLEFEPSIQAPTLHPAFIATDSKRSKDLAPVYWLYEDGPLRFLHSFHVSRIKGTDYSDLQSAYGYGGPVTNTRDPGFLSRVWESYRKWCGEKKIIAEFLRFHPVLKNWDYYGGNIVRDRQTVWIDLRSQDLMSQYEKRVRTAIRKAEKAGLKVSWLEDRNAVALFPGFFRNALREITKDNFYFFSDEYFASLFQHAPAKLAIATLDSEIVAAVVFLWGPIIMEYHLSASTSLGRSFNATSLILHEAGMSGRKRGCEIFYLGGGTDDRPDNPLFFFKAGFSPQRSEFKIGKFIHEQAAYESMKERFMPEYQKHPERVLFYR